MKGLTESSCTRNSPRYGDKRLYLSVLGFLVAFTLWTIRPPVLSFSNQPGTSQNPHRGPSLSLIEHGQSKCLANQQRPEVDYTLASKRLANLEKRLSKRLILRNVTLIDGDGRVAEDMSLIMRGGIIEKIEKDSRIADTVLSEDDKVMHLNGRYLTPGLIEMHSHAGVRALPQLWASEDVTETSSPIAPWARAIDGYKSNDMAIDLIASGGVTTSLVLTGAQSIMSGEGYVFKMKRDDSPYAMLVNTSAESGGKPQRYLKMALGENIKKTFQDKIGGPVTREGISFYFREALEEAKRLKSEQDRWCEAVESKSQPHGRYPESLKTQTLVDLLRGDLRLNVHCYETEDVFSLFDHSDEYGFNVTAVHHAMASHYMTDELLKRKVAVATFSDEWGFKPEDYDTSFYLSKALVEAGIPLALTSDHPAEYGKFLSYQAQVAYNHGVDAEHAIASLIGVPAKYLGLDNRVGSIRPGFDADLVVWNRHPLRLGASPLLVTINGHVTINASHSLWAEHQIAESDQAPPQRTQRLNDPATCAPGQRNLVVNGIVSDYLNDGNPDMELNDAEMASDNTATAVIRDGKLACVGRYDCRALASELVDMEHYPVMNVTDGHVLPV